ncbi:GNAT family protein [Paenibacillus sp. JX-17]|uniref:GNAT family protein n=1 Tax=Paenibacillus lacisoli TaxID=3064525 RepID=A0ABT9CCN6_9BACL|nr:GNAT family protein [Paenibacillus sp. JX-17]MDO7907006.1 GNAT family protein [Paenibacillus sp. JX-17]
MELETERLWLREAEAEDWRAIHEYASDPAVTVHTHWGPNSEQETRDYVKQLITEQQQPRTVYELVITLKSDGSLIGGCGLHRDGYNAELGYCLNPAYWGSGYAAEASRALLAVGFAELGIHRIYAKCRPENTASASVMRTIGMKQEGYLREHWWYKGKFHDSLLYSILHSEHESTPSKP